MFAVVVVPTRGLAAAMFLCSCVSLATGCVSSDVGAGPNLNRNSHERGTRGADRSDREADGTADPPELPRAEPDSIADDAPAPAAPEQREPNATAPAVDTPAAPEPSATQPVVDLPSTPELPALPRPIEGACTFEEAALSDTATDNPNCPNGTFDDFIVLKNATDIERLRGCTRVTLGVSVEMDDAPQLTGLESLRVIEGGLWVQGMTCEPFVPCEGANAQLASLNGLQGLRCIGGDLTIDQPDPKYAKPLDLTALDNVVEVGGSVRLKLVSGGTPSPLAGLRRVWRDFTSSVGAFPSRLEAVYGRVQGELAVPDSLYVGCSGTNYCRDGVLGCAIEATTQSELDQLSECEIALDSIMIASDEVSDLTPLSKLKHVEWFSIRPKTPGGGLVQSLGALQGLRTAHAIVIDDQPELASLEGLSELVLRSINTTRLAGPVLPARQYEVGSLWLDNLPALTDLRGLAGLEELVQLSIRRCPRLQDLQGLESLRMTHGPFELRENAQLQSLNGLANLESTGSLTLVDNPLLADISALSGIPRVGYLTVTRLPLLADLTALRGAQIASIFVTELRMLKSLEGLEGISTYAGFLSLKDNDALEDIRSLANIQRLQSLTIVGNASLSSLAGLESLRRVNGTLVIRDNAQPFSWNEQCAPLGCDVNLMP